MRPTAFRALPLRLSKLLAAPLAILMATLLSAPAEAAPRCTSKPAVCSRLRSVAKQRPTVPVVRAASTTPRCTSKPAVCSRLKHQADRPKAARAAVSTTPRCTSKPAVCARLGIR